MDRSRRRCPGVHFDDFVAVEGERLRHALRAAYGPQVGAELHADAMVRAWAEWERVRLMANPAGYLWRAARGDLRRYQRWKRDVLTGTGPPELVPPPLDGELLLSLDDLSPRERIAVVMVHVDRASYADVGEVLGVPVTTVTNLVYRGLQRLRRRHDRMVPPVHLTDPPDGG